jgi:hypothetical protein
MLSSGERQASRVAILLAFVPLLAGCNDHAIPTYAVPDPLRGAPPFTFSFSFEDDQFTTRVDERWWVNVELRDAGGWVISPGAELHSTDENVATLWHDGWGGLYAQGVSEGSAWLKAEYQGAADSVPLVVGPPSDAALRPYSLELAPRQITAHVGDWAETKVTWTLHDVHGDEVAYPFPRVASADPAVAVVSGGALCYPECTSYWVLGAREGVTWITGTYRGAVDSVRVVVGR